MNRSANVVAVMFLSVAAALAYPQVYWARSSPAPAIGNRTVPTCASRTTIDAKNVTTSLIFLYGGYNNGALFNDVYLIDYNNEPTFKQTVMNGEGPGDELEEPMLDILASGLILLYGGSITTSSVFSSKDGTLWNVATKQAAWSPREGITSHTTIPFTNTVVMAPGDTGFVVDNATWVCNDNVGAKWFVGGYMPVVVEGAPLVAINPSHSPLSNGTILLLGGLTVGPKPAIINTIYLSNDLGATWITIQPIWSPRYQQTAVADVQNNVYMLNGLSYDNGVYSYDYNIWWSPDAYNWLALTVASTMGPLALNGACTILTGFPPEIVQIGGVYNYTKYNGYVTAIIDIGNNNNNNSNNNFMLG